MRRGRGKGDEKKGESEVFFVQVLGTRRKGKKKSPPDG